MIRLAFRLSVALVASAGASFAAVLLPTDLAAQVSTADEGTFTVSRAGTRIGREEFRIVKQPVAGGLEYVASGRSAYGDRRITAALQTDATGAPLRYQVDIRNGTESEARLTGTIVHGRFSAQVKTARGEAASEYSAGDGTLVLDDEIFHQYFFLGVGDRMGAAGTSIPLLVPRRNAQGTLRVTRSGSESIAVGSESIPATRLMLSAAGIGGAAAERTVWVDAAGRVLKVTLPAQGIVALRDDPPGR